MPTDRIASTLCRASRPGPKTGGGGKSGIPAAKDILSREAGRLLAELGQGRLAMAEIAADRVVLVKSGAGGVSLAGARFAMSAAKVLIAADLAAWEGSGKTRRLVIQAAGLARLRRLQSPADHAFLAQHRDLERQDIENPDGGRVAVLRDAAESPLAWLRRRKDASGQPLIGEAAFAAGERLRADLTLARTLPRVTVDWSRVGDAGARRSGGTEAMLDCVLAARQRVDAAAKAVGPELAGLLIDICGFLKGLEDVERERLWPARSAKVVLRIALGRLAAHYGYSDEIRGPAHAGAILAWSA